MGKLHHAVKSDDVEEVRRLLERGEDVNTRERLTHHTPLHRAAARGQAEMVRVLLDHGADVAACAARGGTPLHGAHDLQCARLLIAAGAPVDARTKNGRTSLHEAAAEGNVEVVTALLESGADVNALTDGRESPLDLARVAAYVHKDQPERYRPVVEALEAAGGRLSRREGVASLEATRSAGALPELVQRGAAGETVPLLTDDALRAHLAADARFGLDWLLGLALAGDTLGVDPAEVEPLQWALGGHRMTSGHSEIAGALLRSGANAEVRLQKGLNDRGRRLLWEAFPPRITYDPSHITALGMLMDPGSPFDDTRTTGPTFLFLAVVNNDPGLVDALTRAGADPNARTDDDHTALHWAVVFGAKAAAEHLLTAGAEVNARTARDKETPLAWATRRAAQEDLPVAGRKAAESIAQLLRARGGVE